MADYKRLVSYIYAYPGGVRDKNVGFAKAEVRNGQFKLAVSLKGVYTDTPEIFGIYVMVDKQKHKPGGFTLLKTGTVLVNQGIGRYQDIFNPLNINQTGYKFEDISGIAITKENDVFYRMFSLWEDCILNTDDITIASLKDTTVLNESEEVVQKTGDEETGDEEEIQESPTGQEVLEVKEKEAETQKEQVQATEVFLQNNCEEQNESEFEKLFINADYVDVFEDDYFYDCVELVPERLKKLPVEDEAIINNSFLVHGYYNFKHILFGKVRENDNGTHYFIGVPGMYCNRERFMASMFGFGNFKKSHRSDYSNPYFGYWYQEI